MAKNRSFKDYVADKFEDELFAAIQSYVEEYYDALDLRLYKIQNIGDIKLSGTNI